MVQTNTSLGKALAGARVYRYDPAWDVYVAWFGGSPVFAYDFEGTQISAWNMGKHPDHDNYTPEEALESIERHIADHYYP